MTRRSRIAEALRRGERFADVAERESVDVRDVASVAADEGITYAERLDARMRPIRERKAKAHGLRLAGMCVVDVEKAAGVRLSGISACTKPPWWNQHYDEIAKHWWRWAQENVPPAMLQPHHRIGRRSLVSRGQLSEKMADHEVTALVRAVKLGMTYKGAASVYKVSAPTAKRVVERAREMGLA